jgi:aminoglycoside 6'-N-acetyltransferase I
MISAVRLFKRVLMRIRKATKRDKSQWIALRAQLWPRAELCQLREEVDKMLEDVNWGIFTAGHEGKIVGFIECSIRDKAPACETNRIGYIEGWFVTPQYRNQGVGASLAECGEKWAKEMGCREMASDTTSEFPSSPIAHKALGYQEVKRKFYYRKSLS